MTVGLLADDVENPFFGITLLGIAEGLVGSDYAPLIMGGPSTPDSEATRIDMLLSRRVDGIIIVTCRLSDEAILRLAGAVPTVVAGRDLRRRNLFSMKVDNALGGELATAHLLELGHRRIAHLRGPEDHIDAADRFKGYRRALRAAGVPIDPRLVVPAGFLSEDGRGAVERLLDSGRRFTAVFAANDECAYGARLGLHHRGIRVPEDVSLVGFDDLPGSRYTTPPLTTVRQPLQEMGRRAARSILDLLRGRKPRAGGLLQVELVVRETTAPPASLTPPSGGTAPRSGSRATSRAPSSSASPPRPSARLRAGTGRG
jgi:LacI family transcriptional regulator